VYDKANTEFFKPISLDEKHELYMRLSLNKNDDESLFTKKTGGKVVLKENRPILLISSTSWTKDEVSFPFSLYIYCNFFNSTGLQHLA